MHILRKATAILLVAVMFFSMTACSKKNMEIKQEDKPSSATPQSSDGAEHSVSFFEKTEVTVDEQQKLEETAEDTVTLGVVEGSEYRNDWIGYGCTVPSGWSYASSEYLLQANQDFLEDVENLEDEELRESLSNVQQYTEMYTEAPDGLCNINITVENLGLVYGTVISLESYIDMACETLGYTLVQMGYDSAEVTRGTIMFDGEERPTIVLVGQVQGNTLYQLMVPVKVDRHIANICFTSFLTNETEEMAAWFYKI